MQMSCIYDRVPEVPFLVLPKKGRPNRGLLYQYSKKYGFLDLDNYNTHPHTRGGMTTVFLHDEDGQWLLSGVAVCSMSDNFSYKEGRERALLRATNLGLLLKDTVSTSALGMLTRTAIGLPSFVMITGSFLTSLA